MTQPCPGGGAYCATRVQRDVPIAFGLEPSKPGEKDMATAAESTPIKSASRANAFTFTALVLVGATLSGANAGPPLAASAVSGQHKPNRFLNELEYEHAYPAAPSHPYVRTIARAKAFEAFQDVRSGDRGHGRGGAWRTVGPATVLNPADPATPGAGSGPQVADCGGPTRRWTGAKSSGSTSRCRRPTTRSAASRSIRTMPATRRCWSAPVNPISATPRARAAACTERPTRAGPGRACRR